MEPKAALFSVAAVPSVIVLLGSKPSFKLGWARTPAHHPSSSITRSVTKCGWWGWSSLHFDESKIESNPYLFHASPWSPNVTNHRQFGRSWSSSSFLKTPRTATFRAFFSLGKSLRVRFWTFRILDNNIPSAGLENDIVWYFCCRSIWQALFLVGQTAGILPQFHRRQSLLSHKFPGSSDRSRAMN